jgi:hypothetical protein
MNTKPSKLKPGLNFLLSFLALQALAMIVSQPSTNDVAAQAATSDRRVHVPNLLEVDFTPAIFWMSDVNSMSNYSDVRLYYFEGYYLGIVVHTIDRLLWYDTTPSAPEIPAWDSVSVYLDLDGNVGSVPDSDSYRFDTQLYNNIQAYYRGNGSDWISASIPITSYTGWRGTAGPNSTSDNEGWVAYFEIPFTSLGLAGTPPQGTQWGLGLVLHDRDDAAGAIREDTTWPEAMNTNSPSTWGQLSFGPAIFTPPQAGPGSTVMIRQGYQGATVVDAAVGGYTTCGNDGVDKWIDWGDRNYAADYQFNIQNQWDIADWPCFSKYYVTFPLEAIPAEQAIISATLTMNLLGTAGGGQWGDPPNSYIQVFTVDQDWDESTLTWNNAPPAVENISGTWVYPVVGAYHWDVGLAVTQAYAAGEPLRLALYSADGDYHTGKYFFTSDSNDWGGEIRPTLRVTYGSLTPPPPVERDIHQFLPTISR